jgi:protein arginine N-methyltransferase 1
MLAAIEDAQYKEDKIGFWDDVYGFDMSCIKRMALAEPLVDTVAAEQLVSSTACVKTIDIATMTKADCCIDAPFALKATRNDYVHALVAWFDVHFTACHKPLGFSTGPKAKSTHWKQTVLYLDAAPAVCAGETLTGRLTCVPNARNARDLDIALEYSLQGKRAQLSGRQEYRMR